MTMLFNVTSKRIIGIPLAIQRPDPRSKGINRFAFIFCSVLLSAQTPLITSGSTTAQTPITSGKTLIDSYSVNSTRSSVSVGGTIVVSWTAPDGHSPKDWIGLYPVSGPSTSFKSIIYLGSPTSGTFSIPANSAGQYELRYAVSDSYNFVATSAPVTVNIAGKPTVATATASAFVGGTIMVSWTAPDGHSSKDWIGLYPVGGPSTALASATYLGSATSGAFSVPAPVTPGQYELRYAVSDSYNVVATSMPPVTVTVPPVTSTPPANVAVTGRPTVATATASAFVGGTIMVSWTAPDGHSSKDWIGLYPVGGPSTALASATYLGTATSGAFSISAPATPGQYELRYAVSDSYNVVATSTPPVNVTAPVTTPVTVSNAANTTVTTATNSVSIGGTMVVSWTAPIGHSSKDWIGLYPVGAPNTAFASPTYLGSATSGAFSVTAPVTPGQYELRYAVSDSYTVVVTSAPIAVNTSAKPTVTTTTKSVSIGGTIVVSWTAPIGHSSKDWIGLYLVGAPNTALASATYLGSATSGAFSVSTPATPGQYELRYAVSDSYSFVASSAPVTVTSPVSSVSVGTTVGQHEIVVPAGGDLQVALDNAKPGDTITLISGTVYTGNFILRNKGAVTSVITIRSSSFASFKDGVRVSPANASLMATLMTTNASPIITTEHGTNHYRITGLEITPAAGQMMNDIVQIGLNDETTVGDLPSDIQIDHVYIHGDLNTSAKRGIAANGVRLAISDSYIVGMTSSWQDTQAICGWNTPGPVTIINNHLEATGENVMFGGADRAILGISPTDIKILGNYIHKPFEWRARGEAFATKNLVEFKNGHNILIEGNILDGSWGMLQGGPAIVLTPRTETGTTAWVNVDGVVMRNNLIRNCLRGVVMMGQDTNIHHGIGANFTITNNLFENIDSWGFLAVAGPSNLVIDHNTVLSGAALLVADELPAQGFVFTNNIGTHGTYGVLGSGKGIGTSALEYYFPGYNFSGNVIADDTMYFSSMYPGSNSFTTFAAIGFNDPKSYDYRLLPTSPYLTSGTDGKPAGADADLVVRMTANVEGGVAQSVSPAN